MLNKVKRYTPEFKDQAVELAKSMGNTLAAAKQLGISDSVIHEWRKKKNNQNGPHFNNQSAGEPNIFEENKRLRKENADLKQANYILKRAAAYFSQDELKKSTK